MRSPATIAQARPGRRRVTPARQTARSIPVPAPVGGWNARDGLALMDPGDAVTLDNFFPQQGKVVSRGGFASHATGVGSGNVETIAEFHSGSTRKLITAGGGKVYDATSAGAASQLGTGFSNDRWQTANMNAKIGLVNGADAPQDYDGATFGAMSISGSGLTIANLIGINIFKSHSYFWEDNSQDFWYSAVNALGGTLTKFPLSRVGTFGGKLVAMATWTLDAGDGVDDLAVFVMSSGETIVYQGSDPGDAQDWSLVGVYRIGAPLGIRAVSKFGGDLIISTKDGYTPLKQALQRGRVDQRGTISDKISGAVIAAARSWAPNFGWQIVPYPRGNFILFNVPTSSTTFHQHIVNTVTGAWCRFTGLNGHSWGTYNDNLYFGGDDGTVWQADKGVSDNAANITLTGQHAFNYLRDAGHLKRVTALAPVLGGTGDLTVKINVQVDFKQSPLAETSYTLSTGAVLEQTWGSIEEEWQDIEEVWAEFSTIEQRWLSTTGIGYAIAARMEIASQERVEWYATQYLIEAGGVV